MRTHSESPFWGTGEFAQTYEPAPLFFFFDPVVRILAVAIIVWWRHLPVLHHVSVFNGEGRLATTNLGGN